ncbi:MAG: SBBP repeat-containing protein, partial [Taibaiella sp.]|nr:SBBP repeat-containing protein [Taibaiella sp.]
MNKMLIVAIVIFGPERLSAQAFSAFIGGTGYEQVRDIATDCEGNIYITGGTSSTDFLVTIGPKLNTGGKKIMDIFLMKFSRDGKLLWSTLLGGPNYDRAYALEVDENCDVYIAGRAGEGLLTTSCAFQRQFGGDSDFNPLYGEQDGFIAKFSRNGDLAWCSYFGGADKGFIRDIALDKAGNIFIVETETRGVNPHITANALQPGNKGGYDAVVAKITNDGKAVLWATYLGGSKDDMFGPSVRIDSKGRPVVAGTVMSADLPVTSGCYDARLDGESDIYIARLSSDGKELLLGTYLGGSGSEGSETHNLALDKDDNIVIASTTSSGNLPFTGGFQQHYGGDGKAGTGMRTNYPHDGFVVKLSAEGDAVLAGTYIGGS